LGNLTIFLSTGWWVEKRVNDDRFIFVVAVVLGIGANVAAVIFFQILGAGISGITTGLVTMIALGAFEGLLDSTVAPMKGVLVFTISVLYALLSIGAIAPIPAGTAVEVHLLGAMFGAAWYATEKFRYDFSLNA